MTTQLEQAIAAAAEVARRVSPAEMEEIARAAAEIEPLLPTLQAMVDDVNRTLPQAQAFIQEMNDHARI